MRGLAPPLSGPTTPNRQRRQAVPPARFGLFPFRSPLLRESLLLSSPRGTEMFQFPRFPPPGLCVQPGVTGHLPLPGFPIRTSTDQSLVGSSPWLIAATHVLLRLQAPRHPPLALCSLENKDARARYGVLKGHPAPRMRGSPLAQGKREADVGVTVGVAGGRPDPKARCRSLKTEQRCPPVLAAPHRRPMVYDRGVARTTE